MEKVACPSVFLLGNADESVSPAKTAGTKCLSIAIFQYTVSQIRVPIDPQIFRQCKAEERDDAGIVD